MIVPDYSAGEDEFFENQRRKIPGLVDDFAKLIGIVVEFSAIALGLAS